MRYFNRSHLKSIISAVFGIAVLVAASLINYGCSTSDELDCNRIAQSTHSSDAAFRKFTGYVTHVSDGDTVTVQHAQTKAKYRIRLLGIDAPETKMAYGQASQLALERLLRQSGYQVSVVFRSNKCQDRYGRLIAKLEAGGKDLNLEMVRQGAAWFYSAYSRDLMIGDVRRYRNAMEEAQQKKLGLWKEPQPVEPWEWRKQNRRN